MKYRIYESSTGNLLGTVDADQHEIETLSSDNAEGHFRAGDCEEVAAVAPHPDRTVFATLAE